LLAYVPLGDAQAQLIARMRSLMPRRALTWLYISGFIFVIGAEINAILEHAALDGKRDGACDEGEVAPPPLQRPSFLPPGAVKNAKVAARALASL